MIGELFSKYQPGTKRTRLIIVILRQLHHAATLCSTLFRRRQSVTLLKCGAIITVIFSTLLIKQLMSVFCPGFQKGRLPSEKGTLAQ